MAAGAHSIHASYKDTADPDFLSSNSNSASLTDNRAPLTVTASNQSMTYCGSLPSLTYTYTGLVNGDTSASFTGSLATTATSSSNVGSFFITQGSLAATGNYAIGVFNSGKLTINPATLTVTADNASKTYGDANPSFSASYSGFVNGDTTSVLSGSPSLTTTATATS